MKTYSDLVKLKTLQSRFDYLKLNGVPCYETFGSERYLNQKFYMSQEWLRKARREVILRDSGCELGLKGFEISGRIIVHHINPITIEDILDGKPILYDKENLICCSFSLHNAIHYSSTLPIEFSMVERFPEDTLLW